jgi:malate dehydrogenase (oxaloacetate-decarboxylating)
MEIDRTGYDLILSSLLNKGTAFSEEERDAFMLHGLLPPHIATLEDQRDRAYEALHRTAEPVERYVNLRSLQDANETLFYSLLLHHIEELMPIVYTPTVGEGCIRFSHLFRRPRGIFIAYPNRDKIDQMLAHPRFDPVEVIVVSDGERILGLGDQGAGGMGIPIGKLCLYTGCAGIAPDRTLPILLDVGTDNEDLLSDPLYIGWKHPRIRGEEYDAFVDQFVEAVKRRFPHVLLQWEDFAQPNAGPILERYRDKLCTFNDDIQGTAAVAVGTLLSAVHVAGQSLTDQRIVVVGAGGAGCGISRLIKQAMIGEGMSPEEASSRFYLVDRDGLLLDEMENLLPFQKEFAQKRSWEGSTALLDVVRHVKPTLLIGVCGQPGMFSEEVVKEMASHVDRPIIFPLSNPTSRSEAAPADLMSWTDGKVIMGTGSPFDPIERDGKPFRVDQTNNAYIFPGMGLGLTAVQAERVTDEMFMVAAKTLADCSPAKRDSSANLLPPLSHIREVSFKIAIAVAEVAKPELSKGEIEERVLDKMWEPVYVPYEHRV